MPRALHEIFHSIDLEVTLESIQELIRDIRATRHGDRINRLFHLVQPHLKIDRNQRLYVDSLFETAKPTTCNTEVDQYLAGLFVDVFGLLDSKISSAARQSLTEKVLLSYKLVPSPSSLSVIKRALNR